MNFENCLDKKKTEFESKLLNARIVSIKNISKGSIKCITEECKKRGFDYAISKVGLDQKELINEMLNYGFEIFGSVIILKTRLGKEYEKNQNIREYKVSDMKKLRQITKGAFPNVHWYHDKHFVKGDIDALYIKWLENSCGGRAEIVLVYEENGNILGYIACNKRKNIGIIDLIAVSGRAKRKGIGKALVNAAQNYFKKKNFEWMEVKTELGNIGALNLYNKCGFRLEWAGLNINKWLK